MSLMENLGDSLIIDGNKHLRHAVAIPKPLQQILHLIPSSSPILINHQITLHNFVPESKRPDIGRMFDIISVGLLADEQDYIWHVVHFLRLF